MVLSIIKCNLAYLGDDETLQIKCNELYGLESKYLKELNSSSSCQTHKFF